MSKKWLYAGISLLIVAALSLTTWMHYETSEGDRMITVTIVDRTQQEEKVVFEQSYQSDATNLTDFLKEQEELQAEIENSTYGSLLTSIYGLDQDMENGPWLVFESEDNTTCQDNGGMCPAMDEVALDDGDHFTFALIAGF